MNTVLPNFVLPQFLIVEREIKVQGITVIFALRTKWFDILVGHLHGFLETCCRNEVAKQHILIEGVELQQNSLTGPVSITSAIFVGVIPRGAATFVPGISQFALKLAASLWILS